MPYLDHGLTPHAEPPSKGAFARMARLVVVLGAIGFVVLNLVLLLTGYFQTGHPNKRAEAEQMLGYMREQARIMYSRTAIPPERLSENLSDAERRGTYFHIHDRVYVASAATRGSGTGNHDGEAMLVAVPVDESDGWCVHTFRWEGGHGAFEWFDAPPAWLHE